MPVHPAEAASEAMFRENLTTYIRMVMSGESDEELKKYWKDRVSFPFGSLTAHICSDWAENNLQTYIASTSKK